MRKSGRRKALRRRPAALLHAGAGLLRHAWASAACINAYIRIGSFSDLFTSRYGELVLVKTAALVVLGVLGYRHRVRHRPGGRGR